MTRETFPVFCQEWLSRDSLGTGWAATEPARCAESGKHPQPMHPRRRSADRSYLSKKNAIAYL